MTIPKTLKIGGKIYTVEITDQLYLGRAGCTAEVLYDELVIRIAPQAIGKMKADLMHEMMHAIYDNLGYKEQDEKHIEEIAQALYAVVVDNPKMFVPETADAPVCESCRRIEDPAKDIFIRSHAPGTREEYHTDAKARFCPVCGREIVRREMTMEEYARHAMG